MTRPVLPARRLIVLGAALGSAVVLMTLTTPPRLAAALENDHDHGDQEEPHADDPDAVGGGGHHDDDDEHGAHEHDEHDRVRLSPDERIEFGIEIAVAGPGRLENRVQLPGEVIANGDRLAHIVPRYSGIVTEVRANIGDRVQKGHVLAIVESDESLAPFEVKTLIGGTVIAKHITLGEAVSRDRDAFVIADLSSVWVDLAVYQQDLGRVRVGQTARLYVGHDPTDDDARISYVTPTVDEHTRTATARIVLPNPDGVWRPGMFVTAQVLVQAIDVPVAVPRTALQTIEGATVVFVETADGFEVRPLELGRSGARRIEVLAGLNAGDPYVARGAFTLKAELGKSSFGDGHAH